MACLPKASPGRGRRLSELVEEQQEPFLLDVYLLEMGYSDRLFAPRATGMCWPINTCKMLKSLPSHGFRRRCRLFKCMITKFLNGKAIRKALNWDKKVLEFSETGSKNNVMRELDEALQWRCMEVDDSKQVSPVSVLELHSYEGSSVHITNEEEDASALNLDSPRKDLEIFRELVELAYTSALNQFAKSRRQFDQPEKLLLDCELDNKRLLDCQECLAHEIAESIVHEEDSSLQRQREDLTSISQLTFSDISNSKREWCEFQPQVREIGMQIEEVIFEDIREDVILEVLGFHCTLERS